MPSRPRKRKNELIEELQEQDQAIADRERVMAELRKDLDDANQLIDDRLPQIEQQLEDLITPGALREPLGAEYDHGGSPSDNSDDRFEAADGIYQTAVSKRTQTRVLAAGALILAVVAVMMCVLLSQGSAADKPARGATARPATLASLSQHGVSMGLIVYDNSRSSQLRINTRFIRF